MGICISFSGIIPSRLCFGGLRRSFFGLTERSAPRRTGLAFAPHLFGLLAVLVNANRHVSNDHVVDAHAAFELEDLLARSFDLEKHVMPFGFFIDRVSKLPAADVVHSYDGA